MKNIRVGSWSFLLDNCGKLFVEQEEKKIEKIDITPNLGVGVWISDFDVYYDKSPKEVMKIAASAVFLDSPPSGMQCNIKFQSPFSLFGGKIHYAASAPFVVGDQIYFQDKDNKLIKIKTNGSQKDLEGPQVSSSPFIKGDWIYFQDATNNGLCKIKFDGTGKEQIGGHTTSSRPFVTDDDWVYFQGTNNCLYKITTDGKDFTTVHATDSESSIIDAPFILGNTVYFRGMADKLFKMQIIDHIPGQSTTSAPFVLGDWVYFRGEDDGLYKVKTDGTGKERIGVHSTLSTPFVVGDWVYFHGIKENGLYKVKTDGTGGERIGGNSTLSTPFVVGDWIYFRGTDDGLYKVKADSSGWQFLNNKTKNSPFVKDGWVYFQGTNDGLYRVKTDGSQGHQIGAEVIGHDIFNGTPDYRGGEFTGAVPFVSDNYVYYKGKGDDNGLYKIRISNNYSSELYDIPSGSKDRVFLGEYLKSSPVVLDDWIYFQGTDNVLNRIKTDGSDLHNYLNQSVLSAPVVSGGYIYCQGVGNKIIHIKTDNPSKPEIVSSNAIFSPPFVTSSGTNDDWIYFKGTNNGLYKAKTDGTSQTQIGGNTTKSTPFVLEDWVYFHGTDDGLYKVKTDGTSQTQIGGNKTKSTPFVVGDWIYFQGTNNGLYKVKTDGTGGGQIGGNLTSSAPFVKGDWIYFHGTDDGLYKVKTDGTSQTQIGGNTTKSTPFVLEDWVYFRGTNDGLYKVMLDGSNFTDLHETIISSPYVLGEWVYFQGKDNNLYKVKIDGTGHTPLGQSINSTPFVSENNYIYFQNEYNELIKFKTDENPTNPTQLLNSNLIFSAPFVSDDGYVYFRGLDDKLDRLKTDGTDLKWIGKAHTKSSSFVIGDTVYYQNLADNRLIAQKISIGDEEMKIMENRSSKIYTTNIFDPNDFGWDPTKIWEVVNDPAETTTYCKNNIAVSDKGIISLFYTSYSSSISLTIPNEYYYFDKQDWSKKFIIKEGDISELTLVKSIKSKSLLCALNQITDARDNKNINYSLHFVGDIFPNSTFVTILNNPKTSLKVNSYPQEDELHILGNTAKYNVFNISSDQKVILSAEDNFQIGHTEGLDWDFPGLKISVFGENCTIYDEVQARSISISANKIDNLFIPNDWDKTQILKKDIQQKLAIQDKEIISFWDHQKKQFFQVSVEQDYRNNIIATSSCLNEEPISKEFIFVHPVQCQMLLQKALLLYSQGNLKGSHFQNLKDAQVLFKRIVQKLGIFVDPSLQTDLTELYENYESQIGAINSIKTIQSVYNSALNYSRQLPFKDYQGNPYRFAPVLSYEFYEKELSRGVDTFKSIEDTLIKFLSKQQATHEKQDLRDGQNNSLDSTINTAKGKITNLKKSMAETSQQIDALQNRFIAKREELYAQIKTIRQQVSEESSDLGSSKKTDLLMPIIEGATGVAFIGMGAPGVGPMFGALALAGTAASTYLSVQNAIDSHTLLDKETKAKENLYLVNKMQSLDEEIEDPNTITDRLTKLQDGTINIDNLNANKLLVDKSNFETFLSNFTNSHPEIDPIKSTFQEYIDIAIASNNEILNYNAQIALLTQNLITIQDSENEQALLKEQNIEKYDPDLPVFLASIQKYYASARSELISLFYNSEKALQFYGPTDKSPFLDTIVEASTSPICSATFSEAITNIGAAHREILNDLGKQQHTYCRFTGAKLNLGQDKIKELKVLKNVSFKISFEDLDDIKPYNNVRINDVQVILKGFVTANDKIDFTITHMGTNHQIKDVHGTIFSFEQDQIPWYRTYDHTSKESIKFSSHSCEEIYHCTSGDYALLGPFADWQINIPMEGNPGLDLTGLSAVSIEFEGYGYHT